MVQCMRSMVHRGSAVWYTVHAQYGTQGKCSTVRTSTVQLAVVHMFFELLSCDKENLTASDLQ